MLIGKELPHQKFQQFILSAQKFLFPQTVSITQADDFFELKSSFAIKIQISKYLKAYKIKKKVLPSFVDQGLHDESN